MANSADRVVFSLLMSTLLHYIFTYIIVVSCYINGLNVLSCRTFKKSITLSHDISESVDGEGLFEKEKKRNKRESSEREGVMV